MLVQSRGHLARSKEQSKGPRFSEQRSSEQSSLEQRAWLVHGFELLQRYLAIMGA